MIATVILGARANPRIGLRRALGAKRRDIQLQFVLESAMLATGAELTGVLIGLAAAGGAAALGPWDLIVSWHAVGLGGACSTILGLVIDVVPAARAARLERLASLRAE